MNEILDFLPADERVKLLRAIKDPENWNRAVTITGVQSATPNALSSKQENQNALAR